MSSPVAVLVVNSASRTGPADFDTARRRLTDLGVSLSGAFAVEDPARLPGIVDDAITAGARLEFPDGDHEPVDLDDLLQVAVANGRFYGGGNLVAPNAGIDDHLLDVYAIPRGTARQRWQVVRHFVSGAFTERDHVLHLTTRAVRLITEPEQRINVDGELSARTPVRFGLLRNGLKVMVPQASDAARLDA